ncbi:MAG: hypothetical protein NT037_14715 [Hyphomicrobiales bacterium]|nr:hypothetical protein [Hyphomicrobiales bacterium]
MANTDPTSLRRVLVPRMVAAAFLGTIAVLAIASWDVARGRVPETESPLLLDVLNSKEDRTCTRDLPDLAAKHFPKGMAEAEARTLLGTARVTPPAPWFWRPKAEDQISPAGSPGDLSFVRTLRYTPFGNHHVNGALTLADGKVTGARLRVVCALG